MGKLYWCAIRRARAMRQRSDIKNETASKQASIAWPRLGWALTSWSFATRTKGAPLGSASEAMWLRWRAGFAFVRSLAVETALHGARVCDLLRWLYLGKCEPHKMACYTAVVAGFPLLRRGGVTTLPFVG